MGMHANDMQIGNNTGGEEGMPLLQPQSVLSGRDDAQKAKGPVTWVVGLSLRKEGREKGSVGQPSGVWLQESATGEPR